MLPFLSCVGVHYYEGYDFEQLVIPVRLLKLLGVKALISTSAVGAVNTAYAPGDVMILKDHIKFNGSSPLRGVNLEEFGPRFFESSCVYDPALRQLAKDCVPGSGLNVHEGVYIFFPGPQFESHAEVRAARILGADVAGMSVVTETLTAAHCGLPVLALSFVANMCAGVVQDEVIEQGQVDATADAFSERLSAYVKRIVERY